MKHSPSLAIWLGLGAAFIGLLTTFLSLLLAQRKKAAAAKPGDDPVWAAEPNQPPNNC